MIPTPPLTSRQQEIFDFLKVKILKRGYGPTVREIGTEFGIRSPNGVMCHLKALEKKGLITREANMARAIQLANQRVSHSALPDVGRLDSTAIDAALAQGKEVDFAALFDNDENFAVTVTGDHLADHYIADGDTVVLKRSETASNGDIVLATVDGQAAVLRVHSEDGAKVKKSSSRATKPVVPNDVTILGKVVGVIRKY